ncbi:MAG: hypothetical protein JST86_01225 [Bacteroidetes bacterium]|nr:hypothetical protein [Bacteroidota bacterium]
MKPRIIYTTILFLSIAICSTVNAQTIKEEMANKLQSNVDAVWKEADPSFSNNQVPEKWKGFSGVILAQKTKFVFDKNSGTDKLNVYETTHRKIKLLDKDGVNSFSEFYFRRGHDNDGFALHIIKPDGSVDTVSLLTAVLVEDNDNVPSAFTPYFDKQSTIKNKSKSENIYFKLAVSNLEPGDIIDYVSTVFNDNDVAKMNSLEFDPVYYLCHRGYPVVSQKFEIDTDEKSYVNSKSINGAPEFKESNNGGYKVFTWEDNDREKLKDTRWVNEYLVLPMMKFQIIYSKNNDASDLFISDRGELKHSITPEELAQKVNGIYEKMDANAGRKLNQDNLLAAYTTSLLAQTEGYLRKYEAYDAGDEDFIKRVYYVLRHTNGLYGRRLGSQFFAYVMMEKLKRKNIPAELIVTTDNSVTDMDNVIFGTELNWLVKAKNKYVFDFSANSNPFDLKDEYLGNQAYTITLGKNPTAAATTLPITTPEENYDNTTIDATMDEALEKTIIASTSSYKGISKHDNEGSALIYTNVYDVDYLSYYGDNELDALSDKKREEIDRLIMAKKEEFKKRKPVYMKEQLQSQYSNVVSYDNFTLVTDGRTFNKQELKYTEKFVLGDLTRRAGKNVLVNVPLLMGGQYQVKPEDRERKYDVDVRYPHTLSWDINFTIPAGYTVKGLAGLNQSVENETGAFITKATIEGNVLKLNIKKVYKQTKIKKEDFGKMLEFIDAAYNFSQKKILLKKN